MINTCGPTVWPAYRKLSAWHRNVLLTVGFVVILFFLYGNGGRGDVAKTLQQSAPLNSKPIASRLRDRNTQDLREEEGPGVVNDVLQVRSNDDRPRGHSELSHDERERENRAAGTASGEAAAAPDLTSAEQASTANDVEREAAGFGGYAKVEDLPQKKDVGANCGLLFEDDPRELSKALTSQYHDVVDGKKHGLENLDIGDCQTFVAERRYLTKPVSPEEEDFPLAFSITMYKEPEQVERLLRALYRPQNVYCIHIDKKSSASVLQTMSKIAKCFSNVFLTSKRASVSWGYYSVLEPELHCIDELVKHKKWKYLINLTGQEFPLKTNLDMVKIFKVFQGANDVPGSDFSKMSSGIKERIQFVHKEGRGNTRVAKKPFAYNITMAKGSVHMLISRQFAEFVATDPVALEFRKWSKDCAHPDEFFFNSLEYSPQLGVPGAYTDEPDEWMGVTRWKEWEWYGYKCQGKWVRSICIVGVGDLPTLFRSKAVIVNKLHADFHPVALDCLEELNVNRTRDEILGRRDFDLEPYSQLKLVKNRLKVLYGRQNTTKT